MQTDPEKTNEDRVSRDLFCIYCGYNLKSVRYDEACPECGKPVNDTFFRQRPKPGIRTWALCGCANTCALFAPGLLLVFLSRPLNAVDVCKLFVLSPAFLLVTIASLIFTIPEILAYALGLLIGIVGVSVLTEYCVRSADRPLIVPLKVLGVSLGQILLTLGLIAVLGQG